MRELFGQGARAFLLTNASFAINFAGNLALVRILTPTIFGTYAVAVALLGIVEIFTTFALQTVYLQRRPSKRLLAAIFQALAGIAGIKLLVVLGVFLILRGHYSSQVWMLVALIFTGKLLVPFNAVLVALLEKQFRFSSSAFVMAASNSGSVVVAVALGYAGAGIYSLVIRDTLPTLITLALALSLNPGALRAPWRRFNLRQTRVLMRSAFDMYAVRASELAFSKLPLLLVQRLFGVEVLGFLHQALYLVNSVNRVTMVLNQQIATVYFNRYRKDARKTATGFRTLVGLSMLLGMFIAPALFFFPEQVIKVLWGVRWQGAAEMLRILSLLIFVIPVFTILKSQLYGQRRNIWLVASYVSGGLLLTLMLLMLAPIHAPAVTVSVAYLLTFTLMALIAARVVFQTSRRAPEGRNEPYAESPAE